MEETTLKINFANNVDGVLADIETYCRELRADMFADMEAPDAYAMDAIYNLPIFAQKIENYLKKYDNDMDKVVFG